MEDDYARNARPEVLEGLAPSRKRPHGCIATPPVLDPAIEKSMASLYREHGALQALAVDDPSLLPAGMTMEEARLMIETNDL